MRAQALGLAGRPPHRLSGTRPLSRGELVAALATAAVAGQLLFAQLTLAIAVCLVIVGRISKWRLHWLVLPAAAGMSWALVVGPRAAWHGLSAWPRLLASHPAALSHPALVLSGLARWLPPQFPLALLPAAVEAAVVLWPRWWRPEAAAPSSPRLLALVRSRTHTAALAAGHTVTRGGCALGVRSGTGGLAAVSWQEAARGVLLTGRDQTALRHIGLAAACAAIRLRMPVLVADLAGTADEVAGLAARLGVTSATLTVADALPAGPQATTGVLTALGTPSARASVAPGGSSWLGSTGAVPGTYPDVAASLGPAIATRAGPDVAASPRPGVAASSDIAARPDIAASLGLAIRRRGVVLVSSRRHRAVVSQGGSSAPDQDSAIVAELVAVLTRVRDLGLRADCLVWVNGCGSVNGDLVAVLVALGASTGTAVLLTAESGVAPPGVAAAVGVLVEAQASSDTGSRGPRGRHDRAEAGVDAPRGKAALTADGQFTMTVRGARRRSLSDCRAVPLRLDRCR